MVLVGDQQADAIGLDLLAERFGMLSAIAFKVEPAIRLSVYLGTATVV
jgi:hypothetical protein